MLCTISHKVYPPDGGFKCYDAGADYAPEELAPPKF